MMNTPLSKRVECGRRLHRLWHRVRMTVTASSRNANPLRYSTTAVDNAYFIRTARRVASRFRGGISRKRKPHGMQVHSLQTRLCEHAVHGILDILMIVDDRLGDFSSGEPFLGRTPLSLAD